jgi:hypothetical protein
MNFSGAFLMIVVDDDEQEDIGRGEGAGGDNKIISGDDGC